MAKNETTGWQSRFCQSERDLNLAGYLHSLTKIYEYIKGVELENGDITTVQYEYYIKNFKESLESLE